METMGSAYEHALEGSIPSLISQLGAELAAREADRGPEPQLPGPKPDGLLAGLQPLGIVG
jgi:hypothetical protein